METDEPNKDYPALYTLWDEFLHAWPLEKLKSMTLAQYSAAGDRDSFCYWIESRLENLGSIWGGSAFKFGIFSRKDKSEKTDTKGVAYSEDYAWYAKYGSDQHQAFKTVKQKIIDIAEAAQVGDLKKIESLEFGAVIKWKIAFHYQDRDQCSMVDVFMPAALKVFVEQDAAEGRMERLQVLALEKRDAGEGILELGVRVWKVWLENNVKIWKLSHGSQTFTAAQHASFASDRLAVVHQDTGVNQGNNFRDEPDDTLFYLCHGNSVQALARLCGPAVPDEEGWLRRPYRLLRRANHSKPYLESKKKWTPQGNSTFFPVPKAQLPEFEQTLLKPYFGLKLEDLMNLEPIDDIVQFLPVAEPRPADPGALNRILFGPPGTGKTYRSVAEAVAIIEAVELADVLDVVVYSDTKERFDNYREEGQIEFVTFHPSYSYQDFVEGIRPESAGGQLTYNVEPGVLKRIAEAATANWQASRQPAGTALSETERFDRAFSQVLEDVEESPSSFIQAKLYRGANVKVRAGVREQSLLMLQDGYPTQFSVAKSQLRKLWPKRSAINKPADTELYNRSFYYAALKLLEETDHRLGQAGVHDRISLKRFVLIIDEINRGNIAKIFGELITLIEEDKRLGESNMLTVRLPYSPEDAPFGLPPNLYFLGTMNTADRSIALLDTALRRRFDFRELMPDTSILSQKSVAGVNLQTLLETLNQRITFLVGRNHTIGHAYLTGVKDFAALELRFFNRIIPLLQEYFFDDWAKIRMVFKDSDTKAPALQIVRKYDEEARNVFGDDFESLQDRARYEITAKLTPEMIRAIYE